MSNTEPTPSHVIVHKPDDASSSLSPPPYTKDPQTSDAADYGSINEEQTGLLRPDKQPNEETSRNINSSDTKRSKRWYPYLFIFFFVSITIYIYSPSPTVPHSCTNTFIWQDIPSTLGFSKSLEILLDGQVSSGRLIVTPIDGQGTIRPLIKTSSAQDMSFDMQDSGDQARLTLRIPPSLDCVQADLEIALPYTASYLKIIFNNVDIQIHPLVKDLDWMQIQNANGEIQLGRWSGRSLDITQANGQVKIESIEADRIYLQNSNGLIDVSQTVEAKESIYLKNTNGAILTGSLVADDQLTVETKNAPVSLGRAMADSVTVTNANGKIELNDVKAKKQISLVTSNAPIVASVSGEKNNRVTVTTTNNEIDLHMTDEFEGSFIARTTNSDKVRMVKDEQVFYRKNEENEKRGYRHKPDDKGVLQVTTTNGNIDLVFDIPS